MTGWHDPALLPGVVSQLFAPVQLPYPRHLPSTQTS
jgi:hypothetical protein